MPVISNGQVLGIVSFHDLVLMYFGSELITHYIGRDNPWLVIGGIAVISVIAFVLNHRYRQLKARQMACQRPDNLG